MLGRRRWRRSPRPPSTRRRRTWRCWPAPASWQRTESEQGRSWAAERIKALTGGDSISARFMRQDFFEFVPKFEIAIRWQSRSEPGDGRRGHSTTIHRRAIRYQTEGEGHANSIEKLSAEAPQILQWCIDGCRDSARPRPRATRQGYAGYSGLFRRPGSIHALARGVRRPHRQHENNDERGGAEVVECLQGRRRPPARTGPGSRPAAPACRLLGRALSRSHEPKARLARHGAST